MSLRPFATRNRIVFGRWMTSAAVAGLLMIGSATADDKTLPVGGNIVGGTGSIGTPHDGQLDINQTSNRMITNWDSFNIGKDGKVEFFQPSSKALAVNRVTSGDPVQILGQLKANGQVMILDRNGVLFGVGSRIDTGGIIASTGDISDSALMKGGKHYKVQFGNGAVVNEGTINVADNGIAALVAPNVRNSGVINAHLGKVVLAGASGTATVDLYGDGLVELAVTKPGIKQLVQNTGTINAKGGQILMTATAAGDIVSSVVNMNKAVNASSVSMQGNSIVLGAAPPAGVVSVRGTTNGDLTLRAAKVDVTGDLTMRNGNLTVDAKTVNTRGKIYAANDTVTTGLIKPVQTNAQVVNVRSDKASAQQGIDLAGDATVNIAAGTYHENLVIDKDDITVNGAHKGEASGATTRFVNETNIVGDGSAKDIVTITGNRDTLDGLSLVNGTTGVKVSRASDATIKNTLIQHQTGDNIRAIDVKNLSVEGNFMRIAQNGVVIEHGTGVNTISGNSISGETLNGVYTQDVAGLDINHNHVARGVEGINVQTGSGAHIAHNAVELQTGNGISVEDSSGVRLNDNLTDGQGNEGMHIASSDNATLTGNRAYNDGVFGFNIIGSNGLNMTHNFAGTDYDGVSKGAGNIGRAGIRVDNSSNGAILDNTVKGASLVGIYLVEDHGFQVGQVDPANSSHFSNIIDGTRTGIQANYGSDISVAKNLIDHTTAEGIQLNSVKGKSDIDHNHVMHGFQGLLASNDPNLYIGHNVVENMNDDGVRMFNDDNARVVSNRIDMLGKALTTITPGSGTTITSTPGIVDESGLNGGGGNSTAGSVTIVMGSPSRTVTTRTGGNGIVVQSSKGVTVDVNRIYDNGLDGIQANNTKGLTVVNNYIGSDLDGVSKGATNVGRHGVNVQNSDKAVIIGNSILDVGADGIRSDNDTNTRIGQRVADTTVFSNRINGAQTGVDVTNGTNIVVEKNLIDHTAVAGISGSQVNGFDVNHNHVMHGQTGIAVNGMANVSVSHNVTENMKADGINVNAADGTKLSDNRADRTGGNGIVVTNSKDTGLDYNRVYSTGADGVFTDRVDNIAMTNNYVGSDLDGVSKGADNVKGYGIRVVHTDGVLLDTNHVTGTKGDAYRLDQDMNVTQK